MDKTRIDLVLCPGIPARSRCFSVLPFRGWIGRPGLVLILSLACCPALAQHDHPPLRLLILRHDARPPHPVQTAGVDDAEVPALATPNARRITRAFIGRPIDNALLADIRDRLTRYYVSVNRPFVTISIPSQDVAAGVLRVDVNEVKAGRITVEGNRWFDTRQYTGAIRTRPGDPIDTTALAQDTNWINRNPHRQATISVQPGDDPSTYDLAIRTKESLPLDVTLAADNTGTADTGLYRIGLAADWSNALWRGDDLSYAFVTSPDQFRLLENVLSYTAYLPWRDWITISAVNAIVRGETRDTANNSSMNGHADIVSLRYGISLASSADLTHHIELGYDFKTTDSNILTGGSAVFPTTSELDQFVLGYTAQVTDTLGTTSMTAELVGSPGNLTGRNTQTALQSQQPGASPSYAYGQIGIERLTNLPSDRGVVTRLTAQYSSANLLPSEQLEFGGIRSIRGFVELGATRDQGILMQNEFRLAPIKLDLSPYQTFTETLVPFAFLDLGAGRNHFDLPGFERSWLEMVSIGPGLTWQFARNGALRLNWGFPLVRNGHTGPFLGPQFGIQTTF